MWLFPPTSPGACHADPRRHRHRPGPDHHGFALLAPSVYAVLPPRPEVPAPPAHDDDSDDTSTPAPKLAQIYLVVTPAEGHYWSVVQWQDQEGFWHDVEGWRAEITAGTMNWWVEAKDFGTGPFRWLVFAAGGERPLAISQPFYLPSEAGPEVIYIDLTQRGRSPEQPPQRQGRPQR